MNPSTEISSGTPAPWEWRETPTSSCTTSAAVPTSCTSAPTTDGAGAKEAPCPWTTTSGTAPCASWRMDACWPAPIPKRMNTTSTTASAGTRDGPGPNSGAPTWTRRFAIPNWPTWGANTICTEGRANTAKGGTVSSSISPTTASIGAAELSSAATGGTPTATATTASSTSMTKTSRTN